jgi:hypothetical protein
MKRKCRDDERAGLQALLRGAKECLALLPPDSLSVRSVKVLQEGLIQMLEADRRRTPRQVRQHQEEEA